MDFVCSLFLQEWIRRGVLAPSLVVSCSHTDEDIERTIDAMHGALTVYKRALIEHRLQEPHSREVYLVLLFRVLDLL